MFCTGYILPSAADILSGFYCVTLRSDLYIFALVCFEPNNFRTKGSTEILWRDFENGTIYHEK